eukprot:TRINITY_DN3479_c0_g1_i2.p1 TRINITY_DN3479_c0_g1~~TRINITY_DN3479_c0_g1_i2.p1  ORF type:complete len:288 (+),score=90.19 TRINITY_DN3479_c0_g1_i2:84-947(+)
MSRFAVTALLITLGSQEAAGALLRASVSKGEPKRKPNPLERISQTANDAMQDAADNADGAYEDRVKMPVMRSVSRFRMMMCLGRPVLHDHEKCLKFMVKKCKEKTTGQGLCLEFFEYLEKHCEEGVDEACEYLDKLNLEVDRPEKKEEKKEEQENATNTTLPPAVISPNGTKVTNITKVTNQTNATATVVANVTSNASNATEPVPVVVHPDSGTDKKIREMPFQGYNEYAASNKSNSVVMHKDGETHTSDWLAERPKTKETEHDVTMDACKENPDTVWCKLYLQKHG